MHLRTKLAVGTSLKDLLRERLESYHGARGPEPASPWEATVAELAVAGGRGPREAADYDVEAGGDQDFQTRVDRVVAEIHALSPAARRRELLAARRRFTHRPGRRNASCGN